MSPRTSSQEVRVQKAFATIQPNVSFIDGETESLPPTGNSQPRVPGRRQISKPSGLGQGACDHQPAAGWREDKALRESEQEGYEGTELDRAQGG